RRVWCRRPSRTGRPTTTTTREPGWRPASHLSGRCQGRGRPSSTVRCTGSRSSSVTWSSPPPRATRSMPCGPPAAPSCGRFTWAHRCRSHSCPAATSTRWASRARWSTTRTPGWSSRWRRWQAARTWCSAATGQRARCGWGGRAARSTAAGRWRRAAERPTGDRVAHQQRAALTLLGGRVYIAYGGLFGDCGNYVGSVVSAPPTGHGALASYVVPTPREGGIWAPGGAIVAGGRLYYTVGNGESRSGYDGSDSVIALRPDLTL